MTTYTAARTNALTNTAGALSTVIDLTVQDPAAGHSAQFTQLHPDDAFATFTTTDAATVTWLDGKVAGLAAEGITVTKTVP